jgi:hypothetical protein
LCPTPRDLKFNYKEVASFSQVTVVIRQVLGSSDIANMPAHCGVAAEAGEEQLLERARTSLVGLER